MDAVLAIWGGPRGAVGTGPSRTEERVLAYRKVEMVLDGIVVMHVVMSTAAPRGTVRHIISGRITYVKALESRLRRARSCRLLRAVGCSEKQCIRPLGPQIMWPDPHRTTDKTRRISIWTFSLCASRVTHYRTDGGSARSSIRSQCHQRR
jgi:hypothetical protein